MMRVVRGIPAKGNAEGMGGMPTAPASLPDARRTQVPGNISHTVI